MAIVIKPPTPLPDNFSNLSVFLAGSIEMGKAEPWQAQVETKLGSWDVTLLNPLRDEWDSSWKQEIGNPQFREQVQWELDGLDKANLIVVYFDPKTKSPITLLELGLHAKSGKMIVCCPDGYWKKGNVDIVCDRDNIPQVSDLDQLIEKIKQKAAIRQVLGCEKNC